MKDKLQTTHYSTKHITNMWRCMLHFTTHW